MVSTGYIVNPHLDPNHEDEGNTGKDVAGVVRISTFRDKTSYSFAFANQVPFMWNAFWRLVKTEFSFAGALWLHIVQYLHILHDKCCLGSQKIVSLYRDFPLHKFNWGILPRKNFFGGIFIV